MAGVSRSSTMVISWLMDQRDWSAFEATELVRKGREKIKPNKEFKLQLDVYGRLERTFNETLFGAVRRWPNKAQLSRYFQANQTVVQLPQPHWVVVDEWKEFLHVFVHIYLRIRYTLFK